MSDIIWDAHEKKIMQDFKGQLEAEMEGKFLAITDKVKEAALTKRELYAMAAILGMSRHFGPGFGIERIVHESVLVADAMIRRLNDDTVQERQD